ncbi:MAG: putative PEP-CTERM system histidine kinase, partial [Halothiobacillaceae bacterium]
MTLHTLLFATATALFVILLALQFRLWRGQLDLFLCMTASLFTLLWLMVSALLPGLSTLHATVTQLFDIAKYGAWCLLLWHLLSGAVGSHRSALQQNRYALIGLSVAALVALISGFSFSAAHTTLLTTLNTLSHIGMASATLLLIHALLRAPQPANSAPARWLYRALALYFFYDLIFFSLALLGQAWPLLVMLRAMFAIALATVMMTLLPRTLWSKKIHVSHETAHRFTLLTLLIVYLAVILIVATMVERDLGDGIGFSFTLLIAALLLLLVTFCTSEWRRKQLRVFLNKHFFNYKYEYREEWLRFIHTLSRGGAGAHLLETVIEALAQIVNSHGGLLWLRSDTGAYTLAAHYETVAPATTHAAANSSLVKFLSEWQWIINLDEYAAEPSLYQDLILPDWLVNHPNAWLVVPLMQDVELLGFVVIPQSVTMHDINWEDHDLLKTAGRQAATHLAQLMAVRALIEAREFQAFSKLATFVIHDIKNLIAQLSLLVSNAEKHKNNPAFMDDAIKTVANSVAKMNRLLAQLREGGGVPNRAIKLNLNAVIHEVIQHRSHHSPQPTFTSHPTSLLIIAQHDRLAAVLEHLIQNSQEATAPSGWVKVVTSCQANEAIIEISDNGCGMDEQFIRERLFKPFDTTKGEVGMGIGAYESREYLRELSGEIYVTSQPMEGTTL